jgi:hypothetical protein
VHVVELWPTEHAAACKQQLDHVRQRLELAGVGEVLGVGHQELVAVLAKPEVLDVAGDLPFVGRRCGGRRPLGRPAGIPPVADQRDDRPLPGPEPGTGLQLHVAVVVQVRARIVGPNLLDPQPEQHRRSAVACLMRSNHRIHLRPPIGRDCCRPCRPIGREHPRDRVDLALGLRAHATTPVGPVPARAHARQRYARHPAWTEHDDTTPKP